MHLNLGRDSTILGKPCPVQLLLLSPILDWSKHCCLVVLGKVVGLFCLFILLTCMTRVVIIVTILKMMMLTQVPGGPLMDRFLSSSNPSSQYRSALNF